MLFRSGGREKYRILRKAIVAGHNCILSPAAPLSTQCSIEVAYLSPGRCGLIGNSLQNGITLFSIAREKSVKSVTPLGRVINCCAEDAFHLHCHFCSTQLLACRFPRLLLSRHISTFISPNSQSTFVKCILRWVSESLRHCAEQCLKDDQPFL